MWKHCHYVGFWLKLYYHCNSIEFAFVFVLLLIFDGIGDKSISSTYFDDVGYILLA
jgi:hypothetical protein